MNKMAIREQMNKVLFHYRRQHVGFMEAMDAILKLKEQAVGEFEGTTEDAARILLSKKKDFYDYD